MSRPAPLLLALVLTLALQGAPAAFLVKPYLQLGTQPDAGALTLMWHGPDQDQAWRVELRPAGGPWRPVAAPTWVRVAVPTVEPHRVYTALLGPLRPGERFDYRLRLAGQDLFQASARTPPLRNLRVAVTGDLGLGGPDHLQLIQSLYRQRTDLVVAAGDLVYQDGRISEYRRHFFPLYNADPGEPGAPLLRSTLFVGVIGNHDVGERGPLHPVAEVPDAFAYYLYWNQPLNGPASPGAPALTRQPGWTWDAFLAAAGPRFPTMGTFSFDAGGAHWTVLDSNPYTRWEDPALRAWLARDLAAARSSAWRFVVFHHPPFNFSKWNAYKDLWMARLWPLFQAHGVDLVFTGHIHTYVRTRPLLAAASGEPSWDARFDGGAHTRARGPILIVTGAGGAPLHLKGRGPLVRPQPFVARHLPDELSFSVLELGARALTFRQVNASGRTLDRFTLGR